MRENPLKPSDEELVRSYLLGELPEEEADRTEGRLLAEDELFELAEAVEADLLAAAERGELTPAERERVMQRLASSPRGEQRLALARSLNLAARPRPQTQDPTPTAPVVPFRRRSRAASPPAVRWLALAAGVVVVSGLSWYALERPHGGESAAWIARERPAPAHPMTGRIPAPAPVPPAGGLAAVEEPQTAKREPARVVLQLALMATRGSEAVRRLDLPRGTEIIELQIGTEGMEEFKSFDVAVRHAAQTVWEKSGIEPRTLDGVPSLVAELPADRLPSGRCEIKVQGLTPGNPPEDLSSLEIDVIRAGKD
jgi:hypothetical protein